MSEVSAADGETAYAFQKAIGAMVGDRDSGPNDALSRRAWRAAALLPGSAPGALAREDGDRDMADWSRSPPTAVTGLSRPRSAA